MYRCIGKFLKICSVWFVLYSALDEILHLIMQLSGMTIYNASPG